MTVFSNSRLSTFESCPLAYRFRYIEKIKKEEKGIEAFVGSMVHETLQDVLKIRKEFEKELGPPEAREIFLKKWEENYHDKVVITKDHVTPEDYKKKGLRCLKNFFDMDPQEDLGEIVDLEMNLSFEVGDQRMTGYVDRLQREGSTYHIIDYKTSSSKFTQDRADRDRQLALYEIGVREKFPDAEKICLHWYMLDPGEVVSSKRTADELARVKEEVLALIKDIGAEEDFYPNESYLCDWCEYQEECRAEKERRRVAVGGTGPQAEDLVEDYAKLHEERKRLAGEVKALEKRMDELEPKLVDICGDSGAWSLEGREHTLDIKRRMSLNIPRKDTDERNALDELVRKTGRWEELSDLSKSALVDALKKDKLGELAPDIEDKLIEKESFDIKPRRK